MPKKLKPFRVVYKSGNTRVVYATDAGDARAEATKGVYANAGPVASVGSGSTMGWRNRSHEFQGEGSKCKVCGLTQDSKVHN